MLRIEKVFLQGFKSFCDPTEIVFDAEGITAVVGPNGCGKSNVADALSWVIGEQRAKALRGAKMEDVIFQGSRNRKPSGLAEVLLTLRVAASFELRTQDKLEPESPSLPIPIAVQEETTEQEEFTPPLLPAAPGKAAAKAFSAGEKITLARRLYRTGESEYEMNGRTCRLRDIQDLFAGTGLGATHYAIIEQGRIGQVLSGKPLDRRFLIEEAAGISKFKMRQRSAELKLDATQQNLSRLTDIINEVERQQGTLKRQAAKARRFQRLRSEMRELTKAVLVSEYQHTQQLITEIVHSRDDVSKQEADRGRELQLTEERRQVAQLHANQLELQLTKDRAVAAEINLQSEKTRQEQSYLQSQSAALTQRTQQSAQDQNALSERYQLIAQERARLNQAIQIIEEEINGEAAQLAQTEKEYAEQASQDQQTEKQLEISQRKVTETATRRERWSQLVRQFMEALERAQKNLTGLKLEQVRTTEQAAKIKDELSITIETLLQAEAQAQQISAELAQVKSTLTLKKRAASESEFALTELQKQLTIIEQRRMSLVELDKRRAYFSETVQAVMREASTKNGDRKFNIIGTLADFIKVESKDEVLVEAGLKEELQYLLTPSFDDARRAIDFLKREQLGRATFLVIDAPNTNGFIPDQQTNQPIIRLIDLLGLQPALRKIIQQSLPRIAQTVVAEQLEQAITASIHSNGKGNSFLTPTGEFVSAGHIISGGSQATQGSGVLALKREIEELQTQGHSVAQQSKQAEEQNSSLKADVTQLTEQSQFLDAQLRDIEKALVQQRSTLSQYEREQERTTTHLQVVEGEISQAQLEYTEYEDKLRHARVELRQAEAALKEAEVLVATAGEVVTQMRQRTTNRMQALSSRRADFAAKSERRKGLRHDTQRLGNESEELNKRLNRIQMEAIEAAEHSQTLQASLAQLEESLATLLATHQSQLIQIESLALNLRAEKEQLAAAEDTLTALRDELAELREKRAEIDIQRTRLTARLQHLEVACQAELGEKLPELLAQVGQTDTAEEVAEKVNEVASEGHSLFPLEDTELEEGESAESIRFIDFSADFDLETGKSRLELLRNKVESLGPVNLLALQELGEQEDRLGFLLAQKADIEQAVTDTLSVITELKKRSRERFINAFHQINRNFSAMFLELFGGGHGEMRLIDESDVLESGIDIIAQPPGKRLQNVLLLSGGEKAMAALALIMGIFKYRPSPFCLLDEVDAPLDDVNIGRFADKILAMSQHTQFLVITHSKRTMEAAKTLYGVTMEDPGISKLISVRLT